MSPPTLASVGVWIRGGVVPTAGIGSFAASFTTIPAVAGVATTSFPPCFAMPTRSYWPGASNGISAV